MGKMIWIGKKIYLVDEEVEEYIKSIEVYKQAWDRLENFLSEEPDAIHVGKNLLNRMEALKD